MRETSWLNNRHLHFVLYLIIGGLFFYKYGSRVSDWLVFLFIPYTAIIYYYVFQLPSGIGSESFSKFLLIASNIALIIGSYLLFPYVDVQDLQVDRWSVITHYWDAYFNGENPYSSTSHMGNYYGSYPFYFILGLPFYLMNEIGWAAIAGIICFQLLIQWNFRDYRVTLLALVLSVASLCIPYEIVTRSTIFANSVLAIGAVFALLKTWNHPKSYLLWLTAFFIGLLVCTRPIYGLVFLIAGIYLMRNHFSWNKVIIAAGFSIVGLFAPFLHLYFLFPESIFEYNPVAFMTTHFVPTSFYGIYLLIALYLAWACRRTRHIIPASGIFLFLVVVLYALRYIIFKGWNEAIFSHFIDISYFFMALPFIIYTLVDRTENKPAGQRKSKSSLPIDNR